MRLYHRISSEAAESILAGGFRDGTGYYLTDRLWSGVWLADVPLDENEGACSDTLLAVDCDLPDTTLAFYEWEQEDHGYREFLVPADLVNRHSMLHIEDDDSNSG